MEVFEPSGKRVGLKHLIERRDHVTHPDRWVARVVARQTSSVGGVLPSHSFRSAAYGVAGESSAKLSQSASKR